MIPQQKSVVQPKAKSRANQRSSQSKQAKNANTMPESKPKVQSNAQKNKMVKKMGDNNNKQGQQQKSYIWKEDGCYGFDYAVYIDTKTDQHSHSVALAKKVAGQHTMADLERWIKIANSVNKELWLSNENNQVLSKFKLCRNC